MKVMHITAHLGGGAGKAIVEISELCLEMKTAWEIGIILCEKPKDERWVKRAMEKSIHIYVCLDEKELRMLLQDCDVVVFNWWAHPKMYALLNCLENMPIRSILWTHYAGVIYPQLSSQFIKRFDYWCSTCEYSYENPDWSIETVEELKKRSSIIYGIGKFSPEEFPHKRNYQTGKSIKILYVGTVDFSKLHREYFYACKLIREKCNNVNFYIYGNPSEDIKKEVCNLDLDKFVHLEGYADDIGHILAEGDIFAYPLNPFTSGTTENSILEAMAAGLPVVVLNQGTEKNIIDNEKTGVCADGISSYVESIVELCGSLEERRRLGERARTEVRKSYDSVHNAEEFVSIINQLFGAQKSVFVISDLIGKSPMEHFRFSMGNLNPENIEKDKKDYLELLLNGKSKGSLGHFVEIYPDDKELYNQLEKIRNIGI